ncbi:substrate-binding domain-containing protein [Desulfobacula sp.]
MTGFSKYYWGLIIIFSAILSCFFPGCSNDSEYKQVDFSKSAQTASKTVHAAEPQPELRMAVAAMISPKETLSTYKALMDYIGKKAGYKIFLIQRKTYGEINALFQKQKIDLALICSGPYAGGKDIFGIQALAVPLVQGKPYYRSYLIVNQKSRVQTLADLRGKIFAFTDPDSNTGSLVPRYWVALKGETPQTFFKETTYTYSHDNSIIAVARSLVDGAAVDSHIWEYYHQLNPEYTDHTRIIKKSIPFGSPPFVASLAVPLFLRNRIQQILLSMHSDPKGRQIQNSLLIDKFVLPMDSWYQPIIKMRREIERLRKKNANGIDKP